MNNGGRSQRALAMETSLDVQRSLLELNTLGTISLSQAVAKQMQVQKDGLIVVVSSVNGKIGKSFAPLANHWIFNNRTGGLIFCSNFNCL